MKATEALVRLQKTNLDFPSFPAPSPEKSEGVKKQLAVVRDLTFIHIFHLLAEEDEAGLEKIVRRLRTGTPFYDFAFLAYSLSREETDFDFLTAPENLSVYERIADVSEESGIYLPYINVLRKIADNKQFGLYSENQEVEFFLDEYGRKKDSVSAEDFLRSFRKILKYPTQQLFGRFIRDGIFSLIQSTLHDHAAKIASEQTLAIHVYGLHYYQSGTPNADENFMYEHIRFCVSYLARHGQIEFHPTARPPLLPKFDREEDAIAYFFSRNEKTLNSLDRFIALLKDICRSQEANDFCDFLRKNLYKENAVRFDDTKSDFARVMAQTIRKKAQTENVKLYKDINDLLPQRFVCERSPSVLHHDGEPLYIFYDKNGDFLFYALQTGNQNGKVPSAHAKIQLEILKKNKNGHATLWTWQEL